MPDLALPASIVLAGAIVGYGLVRVASAIVDLAISLQDVKAHHTYELKEPREPWQRGD